MEQDFVTLISEPRSDYTLIDSGNGRKYESYGDRHFIRPEPQAMWAPALEEWPADAEFVPGSDDDGGGRWYNKNPFRWMVGRCRGMTKCILRHPARRFVIWASFPIWTPYGGGCAGN